MADGWISLSSQKTTESAPLENKRSISDADMDRVGVWAAVKYFPQGVFVPGDPNASPPVADSYRQPTGEEVHKALTDDIYTKIKNEVDAWYYAQIQAQVQAQVKQQFTPITLTPFE